MREIDPGAPGVRVSMSIGVASYPASARDKDALLGAADNALLRAKALGRDRVCTFGEREEPKALGDEGRFPDLARSFARHAGLTEDEAEGLAAALGIVESRAIVDLDALSGNGEPVRPRERRGRIVRVSRRGAALEALLYANERWDGGGYPEGLSGERIPRVARAFAVLRESVLGPGEVEALGRLRSQAGSRFDPRFVDRLLSFAKESDTAWLPGHKDEPHLLAPGDQR